MLGRTASTVARPEDSKQLSDAIPTREKGWTTGVEPGDCLAHKQVGVGSKNAAHRISKRLARRVETERGIRSAPICVDVSGISGNNRDHCLNTAHNGQPG